MKVGKLIPLYAKHELTFVQVTWRPSLGNVHRLSSNEINLLSVSNVVSAIVMLTTGRDLSRGKYRIVLSAQSIF